VVIRIHPGVHVHHLLRPEGSREKGRLALHTWAVFGFTPAPLVGRINYHVGSPMAVCISIHYPWATSIFLPLLPRSLPLPFLVSDSRLHILLSGIISWCPSVPRRPLRCVACSSFRACVSCLIVHSAAATSATPRLDPPYSPAPLALGPALQPRSFQLIA
jgi:hypothetical protein